MAEWARVLGSQMFCSLSRSHGFGPQLTQTRDAESISIEVGFEQKVSCMHCAKKKATIRKVTTMLAISKNVLFPGHNCPSASTGG